VVQKLEVVQALSVAARISDHYLCEWGELSSSGYRFHPGERPTPNRSPAAVMTGRALMVRGLIVV
jgi:hypothetical protein